MLLLCKHKRLHITEYITTVEIIPMAGHLLQNEILIKYLLCCMTIKAHQLGVEG